MQPSHLPPGFPAVTPYLSVKDPAGLQAFLTTVLDANPGDVHTAPDGHILHGSVTIGASVIAFSGASDQWPPTPAALHVYVPNVDATFAKALAAGGVSLDAVSDKPYGERGGSVRDPFGNVWHLGTYTGIMQG
ncbi:MAG: VOC family protein [Candidatus Sericytochromatia bacterium]|nr:VOC family protein [Candidatus Sericytochromatia bacterium]